MNPIRIIFNVGDPWEFGESLKWQPLHGKMLQTKSDNRGGHALVKLDNPVKFKAAAAWSYIVASPRYRGSDVAEILHGNKVHCAFIGISDQQAKSANWFDTSGWRGGGLTFIGEIQLDAGP